MRSCEALTAPSVITRRYDFDKTRERWVKMDGHMTYVQEELPQRETRGERNVLSNKITSTIRMHWQRQKARTCDGISWEESTKIAHKNGIKTSLVCHQIQRMSKRTKSHTHLHTHTHTHIPSRTYNKITRSLIRFYFETDCACFFCVDLTLMQYF